MDEMRKMNKQRDERGRESETQTHTHTHTHTHTPKQPFKCPLTRSARPVELFASMVSPRFLVACGAVRRLSSRRSAQRARAALFAVSGSVWVAWSAGSQVGEWQDVKALDLATGCFPRPAKLHLPSPEPSLPFLG